MRALQKILSLGITWSLLGCGVLDPDSDRRDDFQEALRRWSMQGTNRYEYRFHRTSCECLPEWTRPYVIHVDDGQVIDSRDAQTGTPAPPSFQPLTILDLFALIDDAIDQNAYVLNVQYDRSTGYPTRIAVDYDRQIADDEFIIQASDLLPLR